MIFAFILVGACCTLLCYACLAEGAKADEYSERQYQEFVRQRTERRKAADEA